MKKPISKRDANRCPSHPGAVLRDIVLPSLKLPKTEIARSLKLSRQSLYDILGERQPVTPETAIKLAAAFGGSAETWLNMQVAYDLWHAGRRVDVSDIRLLTAA